MAEMTVRIPYASKTRTTLLAALKATFPIWGIVAPISAILSIIALLAWIHSGASGIDTPTVLKFFGVMTAGLFMPAICLLATRALSNQALLADKNGLFIPLTPTSWRAYWTWGSVKQARVIPAVAPSYSEQSLVLIGDSNRSLKLRLSRFQRSEIEQILLALDMWAGSCLKDASVGTLLENLQMNRSESGAASFTNMWEEELRRRFCAAAFIPLEPGVHLRNGSLKIIRQLALGGLSALYLAQLDGKTLVVVKEAVVPEQGADAMRTKALEMFERESALLIKLNHKNIVKVLDHFNDNGRNYMMLEYVSGQDMRQLVKQQGPQKGHAVIEWAIQIVNVLKYLHEQDPPIIHRDLTPDNLVLREDGTIVLIDFGAANEFIGNATGTFVGKQSFIAPEQFRGKAVVQSDIYAFGCTLYFLLTGKEPEALSTSAPRDEDPSISEELNEFVMCCTEMESKDRFQSAAQMLPVLRKMAASVMVS